MSRAWRPAHACIYVISDILGNSDSLEIIINRLCPLRKSEDQIDRIVFLGNYIDGFDDGCNVINQLINIKEEYGDRVIILRGKHEELMLRAILGNNDDYDLWMEVGGRTTIAGYLKALKSNASPYAIIQSRISDIVPENNIEFLKQLHHYYIMDEKYCFFNSGFNIKQKIKENNLNNFVFDSSSGRFVKNAIKNKIAIDFLDPYIFVCSANPQGSEPFITSKYMMLGGMGTERIIILELNSMEMSAIKYNKSRIYKYNYEVLE